MHGKYWDRNVIKRGWLGKQVHGEFFAGQIIELNMDLDRNGGFSMPPLMTGGESIQKLWVNYNEFTATLLS